MFDFSKRLGELVRNARDTMGQTQLEVSNALGMDSRTILNIENDRGNPKLCILYPLVRYLKINVMELFYPELKRNTPALSKLKLMVAELTEDEAKAVLPLFQAAIDVIHDRSGNAIE